MKYRVFLNWWLFCVLIAAMFSHALANGLVAQVWESDFTKLSFVNLFLLAGTSLWCGYQSWNFTCLINSDRMSVAAIKKIGHKIETGWFISDLTLTIGMAGTVIGFIAMLGGFAFLDVENISTIQDLITELGTGMSTALYTTLTGLISSALLKVQCYNLSHSIDQYLK